MTDFFKGIPAIKYEGPQSTNEFAFRHYNPDEIVLGKRMEDHLRFAVAYWHSFAWPGGDPIVVRVGHSRYALRRAEAACVRVFEGV